MKEGVRTPPRSLGGDATTHREVQGGRRVRGVCCLRALPRCLLMPPSQGADFATTTPQQISGPTNLKPHRLNNTKTKSVGGPARGRKSSMWLACVAAAAADLPFLPAPWEKMLRELGERESLLLLVGSRRAARIGNRPGLGLTQIKEPKAKAAKKLWVQSRPSRHSIDFDEDSFID